MDSGRMDRRTHHINNIWEGFEGEGREGGTGKSNGGKTEPGPTRTGPLGEGGRTQRLGGLFWGEFLDLTFKLVGPTPETEPRVFGWGGWCWGVVGVFYGGGGSLGGGHPKGIGEFLSFGGVFWGGFGWDWV